MEVEKVKKKIYIITKVTYNQWLLITWHFVKEYERYLGIDLYNWVTN